MYKRLIFAVIGLAFLFLAVPKVHAQDAVEGRYSVGETSCRIEWHVHEFRCYWAKGKGYTVLIYQKDLPNGNIVYDEYLKDWTTYSGTFTFKNDSYLTGLYTRDDGKEFEVERK